MTTEITPSAPSTALAIRPDQTGFTEQQETVLRHMGVSGNASRADAELFFHVAKRSGLDPFARQIYMIERQGKQTIQTGIDGFRLIGHRAARAAGEKVSVAAPQWAHEDGSWRDLWSTKWGTPLAARVTITRDGAPFTAVAMYEESVALKRGGEPNSMWTSRPAGMLAKCAEALAWRMAFPQDLSGLYTDVEMQRADVAQEPPRRQSAADVLGTSEASAEADRPAAPEPSGDAPSAAAVRALWAALSEAGLTEDRTERLRWMSGQLGREITTSNDLSASEVSRLIDTAKANATHAADVMDAAQAEGDAEGEVQA